MNNGQRIIGIDPGLTTGICSVGVTDGELTCIEHLQLDQMDTGHYIEGVYKNWRREGDKPIIVMESFLITAATAKNSQAPWSLEVIGNVRFFCGKGGFTLKFQTPAQAKRLASDEFLKACGLYAKGLPHATDAARHVFTYLVTEEGLLQDAIRGTL